MSDGTSQQSLLVAPLVAPRGGSTTISKTPAASKNRRALGDISNHRRVATTSRPGSTTAGGALVAGKWTASSSFHPTALKAVKPVATSSSPAIVLGAPRTAPCNKASTAAAAATTTTTTSSAAADLSRAKNGDRHRRQKAKAPSLLSSEQQPKVVVAFDLERDDDGEIELPAGRLWIEQNVWADDDAYSAELSLEGAKTGRAELLQALENRYQRRLEREREEDERCDRVLDEAVEAAMQSDLDGFDLAPWADSFDAEDPALEWLVPSGDDCDATSYGRVDVSF